MVSSAPPICRRHAAVRLHFNPVILQGSLQVCHDSRSQNLCQKLVTERSRSLRVRSGRRSCSVCSSWQTAQAAACLPITMMAVAYFEVVRAYCAGHLPPPYYIRLGRRRRTDYRAPLMPNRIEAFGRRHTLTMLQSDRRRPSTTQIVVTSDRDNVLGGRLKTAQTLDCPTHKDA